MPIHMYQKPSEEKMRPGWQTTRFWLSGWASLLCTGVAIWGGTNHEVIPLSAGAFSAAIVAAVYVWAISREP